MNILPARKTIPFCSRTLLYFKAFSCHFSFLKGLVFYERNETERNWLYKQMVEELQDEIGARHSAETEIELQQN